MNARKPMGIIHLHAAHWLAVSLIGFAGPGMGGSTAAAKIIPKPCRSRTAPATAHSGVLHPGLHPGLHAGVAHSGAARSSAAHASAAHAIVAHASTAHAGLAPRVPSSPGSAQAASPGAGVQRTGISHPRALLRIAAGTGSLAPVGGRAEAQWVTTPGQVSVQASSPAETIHLVVGRSLVLATGSPLRRVYVGDPKVLHPYTSGPEEEVITAKTTGVSTLMLWDVGGRRSVYTVFADLDTEELLRVLEDAVPGSRLTLATKGGRLLLGGTVPTDAAADAVFKLASVYSKDIFDGVKVLAAPVPQVRLKLRIVEVDRSRLEQFGVNFFALGNTLSNTSTQQFSNTVIPPNSAQGTGLSVSDPLNLLLYNAKLNVGVTVKDLEQKQVLQVLAEPTLTTMSGMAARFLSGGEFPLPIVQGGTGNSTAITIVFKPYGVKVDFTPTVNADGSIRLKVAPEVSALDYSNAVTISGFTIPALSTRRAETEVELVDGQSFVLSGLLDHRASDEFAKMPGIANVPVLGQLFRSKGVNHSVVELVVLVTATVVDPRARPEVAVLPKMAVPDLDDDRFDRGLPTHPPAGAAGTPGAVKEKP